MRRLNAMVVGCGHMGRNHARVYDDLPGVELVAVVDKNPQRADTAARKYHCEAFATINEACMECDIDLASVATPTIDHKQHLLSLVMWDVHTLVEKPLADNLMDATILSQLREKRPHLVLTVGHIERYNPAVRKAKELIDDGRIGEIYRISTRRVGPSPQRIRDVGVTHDLAVHDLDIMRYITESEMTWGCARFQYRHHGTECEDGISALLTFKNGVVGVLECDWLSPIKARDLTIVGCEGALHVDYINQEVSEEYAPEMIKPSPVETEEPLKVELRAFAAAVRNGAADDNDLVSLTDGAKALAMADILIKDWRA